jgi:hypothetical protein
MEGVLKWYFGDQIAISYSYREGEPPRITVNGKILREDYNHIDALVKYLEGLGLKRLDQV